MQQTNRAYTAQMRTQRQNNNVVRLRNAKSPKHKQSSTARVKKQRTPASASSGLLRAISGGKHMKPVDKTLLLVIIILVVFGLVMVFSASAPSASAYQNNPYHYIIRQALFAVMGFGAMFFFSVFDYHKLGKLALWILGGSLILLLAVYIPGIGIVRNNARRWLNLGFSTLQPSEVVKVSIIIYFSYSLSNMKDRIKDFN